MFEQIDMSWALPCNCTQCQNHFSIIANDPWCTGPCYPSPTEYLCGCYLREKPAYYPYGREGHGEINHMWENWLMDKMEKLNIYESCGVEHGEDWENMCPGFRLRTNNRVEEILI